MSEFWAITNSFPTAIYTTINLVLIGYWLLVALGLFDFEFFDIDIDIDPDIDLDSGTTQLTGFAGFLATFGLTGVPVTIVFTILMFVSWTLSYFLVLLGLFWTTNALILWVAGSIILIISFLFSLPITAQIIKPLRKLFRQLYGGSGAKILLGKPCIIRSSRVDLNFGEALCDMEGASLIINVRAEEKYQFKKGDSARIIEHDKEKNTYFIISEEEFNT